MKLKTFLNRRLYRLHGQISYEGLIVPLDNAVVTDPILDTLWKHDYETPELQAISALMRYDDRVLELGTGMGLVSGIMAKRYPKARFTSYEANPHLLPIISRLHKANEIDNVEVRSGLVAPMDGRETRSFRLHPHFTESSLVASFADSSEIDVDVHDPHAVFAEVRPNLLLCDIEGAEEELIPHLPMMELRAAVIELHPRIVGRTGMARIFKAFLDAGLVPAVEHSKSTVVAFERVESR